MADPHTLHLDGPTLPWEDVPDLGRCGACRRLYRLIERSYELERRATWILSALSVAAFAVGIAVAVLHG